MDTGVSTNDEVGTGLQNLELVEAPSTENTARAELKALFESDDWFTVRTRTMFGAQSTFYDLTPSWLVKVLGSRGRWIED
jgi:hypothetical protein